MSVVSSGPVAIRGLGLASPLGLGLDATMDGWTSGARAQRAPDFPMDGLSQSDVATVPGFRPRKQLPDRKAVKLMSREAQLLVYAAVEAGTADAPSALGVAAERFAAFAAAGYEVTPLEEVLDMFRASRDPADGTKLSLQRLFTEGRDAYNPLSSLKTLPNMALFHAAITLGLRGPHLALGSSAAAGIAALQGGVDSIREGRADAALVGGTDAQVELYRLHYLEEAGALAGAAPGEGAAALVLGEGPGSVCIGAVGLAQEPVSGPVPAEHYSRIDDGGGTRARLYRDTVRAALEMGAPPPDLVFADIWGLPPRDADERLAITEALHVAGVREGCAVEASRERLGQLGAAHGLTDVVLAAASIQRGDARCALVTASGAAGDLGAVVLWGTP